MDKNMRILVVDDFATMRRIVKNLLGDLGFHHIEEADDGSTAQPVLAAREFDLLVLDWNMPGMSGIDLLKWIRGGQDNARLKAMPVLMVTAEAKREQIVEAAQAGVSGYVVKPFTAETLKEKLDRIFARAA